MHITSARRMISAADSRLSIGDAVSQAFLFMVAWAYGAYAYFMMRQNRTPGVDLFAEFRRGD